jgi:hypothetical protein
LTLSISERGVRLGEAGKRVFNTFFPREVRRTKRAEGTKWEGAERKGRFLSGLLPI